MQEKKFINIGLISISDRASQGIYKDEGIPSLKTWLAEALTTPFNTEEIVIPDDFNLIKKTLLSLSIKKNVILFLRLVERVQQNVTLHLKRHFQLVTKNYQVLASKCDKLV